MSVSFRFDNLEYQRQAVNSVISLLEGQSKNANKNIQNTNTQEFIKQDPNQLQAYGMPVHSNPHLIFSKESLAKNLQKLFSWIVGLERTTNSKLTVFKKYKF